MSQCRMPDIQYLILCTFYPAGRLLSLAQREKLARIQHLLTVIGHNKSPRQQSRIQLRGAPIASNHRNMHIAFHIE